MIRRTLISTIMIMWCITLGYAADINGRWEGKMKRPDGEEMQMAFTFKVEGDKLTGKVESPMGELSITDGKVTGDTFSFKIDVGGNGIDHQCKISGDTITMKVKMGQGGPMGDREITLKRVQPQAKAPDLNGRWEGKVQGPDGNEMQIAFNLKVEGEKLTGTVEGPMGEMTITEGVVKGNEFFFKLDFGDMKINEQGKMTGDTIQMKVIFDQNTFEYSLKRAKAK